MNDEITPVFVLGSPRSGTTLIGKLVATIPGALDLGEYGGFYTSYYLIPNVFTRRMPSPFRDEFNNALQQRVISFPIDLCLSKKASFYVDSTPSNILVCDKLINNVKKSIFILLIRHYKGVIQSLGRSYEDGYEWAGQSHAERAGLWAMHYACSAFLPIESTIVVNYDELCADPNKNINIILSGLESFGFSNAKKANLSILSNSYSNNESRHRPTIMKKHEGVYEYNKIKSYEQSEWTSEIDSVVKPIVNTTNMLIRAKYGICYE